MNIQRDHVLHSQGGKFAAGTSQLADVARILQAARTAKPAQGLVLHFHGGLVGETAGRGIAEALAPKYVQAGAYPLFFVWEAGLIESLRNNWRDILADPAFRELVKKVAEWALKKLGGQVGLKGGAGQVVDEDRLRREFDRWFDGQAAEPPVTDEGKVAPTPTMKGAAGLDVDDLAAEIEAGLDADPDFQDAIQKLHNAVAAPVAATKGAGGRAAAAVVLVEERALQELFPGTTATTKGALVWLTVARFAAGIVRRVVTRYAQGRAHGMYCTVVEEVLRAAYLTKAGATVWNQMKKDTADSFGSDAACCGTAVLRELGKLAAAGTGFGRITLVGHSTGAHYICHFLDAAAVHAPGLKFDILFLAPAVRHDRFAATLAAQRSRIGGFRLFGMSDALESDDVLVPILYTRSLLYFISGVLEGHEEGHHWKEDVDEPLVGLQRHLDAEAFDAGDFPAVAQVRQFLQNVPHAQVWSEAAGGNGRNSRSRKHGDFDNDAATVDSLGWIVGHGF